MRRLTKKIAASALALSLVFTMGTQCFAANWGSYFGGSEGWYEGAEGTLTSNTEGLDSTDGIYRIRWSLGCSGL